MGTARAFGPAVLMLLLPSLVLYMWMCMRHHGGALAPPSAEMLARAPMPTLTSALVFAGWFALQAALQHFAPGHRVRGAELSDGSRLAYRMNGLFSFCASCLLFGAGVALGWIRPAALYEEVGPLITTITAFSFLLSGYLYVHGKLRPDEGKAALTGRFFFDYFVGTSRNPRVGTFDWKLFCEARPGLIGWVLLDVSLAAKQYELHGSVSTGMILVCAFHFMYVADYFLHEEAILGTWDIKHENFGWMLCWGDLCWVPLTYTLQAMYLVVHPGTLSWVGALPIAALHLLGYAIFRGANLQKHRFRTDPQAPIWGGKPPESMATGRGTPLLVSGFWGVARHANYLGDLLMGLAWCLAARGSHVLPYFYIVYLTVLLVQRERRDHVRCQMRYGADWDRYCRRVPWRIVPGIY